MFVAKNPRVNSRVPSDLRSIINKNPSCHFYKFSLLSRTMPIRILLILCLLLKTQNLGTFAQQIDEQSHNIPADDQPSPQAGSDWYRDDSPPPSSIINSDSTQLESPSANPPARAFGARTYDSPAVQPQFVDRNDQYRPANPPPAWNPPAAQPQYVPGGPAQASVSLTENGSII